jgi:hypothetical protein
MEVVLGRPKESVTFASIAQKDGSGKKLRLG